MNQTCGKPIPLGGLLDYLEGELPESDDQELESHLFRCAICSSEAERLAGLLTSIADAAPTILSPSRFAGLEREGRIERINDMTPGQTAEVLFPESGRLLVHRLGGIDLGSARRVDIDVFESADSADSADSAESGRQALLHFEDVPFDAERGEVLVACQRHFADLFPPDIVLSVEVVSADQQEEIARYTVHHRLA